MSQTEYRNVELIFGDLKAKIATKDAPNTIQILGFIPADRSTEFTSMNPIYIEEDGDFLYALAISMVKNSLDAVLFGDRDLIIRTEVVPSTDDGDIEYILFLCVPSKPLFDQPSPTFNYPNYSLMFSAA